MLAGGLKLRKLLLLSVCGAVATVGAVAIGQVRGLDVLKHFAATLNKAESLSAKYTITPLGGAPEEYSVELAKPNRARLESATMLLVATGDELITYDKAQKKFSREPLKEGGLKYILNATAFTSMWTGFYDADAFARTVNPIWTGEHARRGMKLDGVKFAAGFEDSNVAILYFEKPGGMLRQGELDLVGPQNRTTYLMDTQSVQLNASIPEDRFSWHTPTGAKEVKKEELYSGGWFTDLREAFAVAKSSKRLLMVDFYADW